MNKKWFLWVAALALTGTLNGCGSESGAPSGSTITVGVDKTWTISPGLPYTFVDQPVVVTVLGPNGQPINNVDITVSLDLAPGTVPLGDEAMFLFEDENRDGVPDTGAYAGPAPPTGPADLAVGSLALPYRTQVNEFGSKQFVLRMSMGLLGAAPGTLYIYRGQVNAVSGSAYGFGTFEVECEGTGCP